MGMLSAFVLLAFCKAVLSSDHQGDALFALKIAMKVPATELVDWSPNLVNPCAWSNVKCDGSNNVVSVTLSGLNCSGTLSAGIGILKNLTTLTLKGNGLTGKIPEEFGNLSSLTGLDMENNHMSGEIPASLGKLSKLQFLTLSQNKLSGSIPETLSNLHTLISMHVEPYLSICITMGHIAPEYLSTGKSSERTDVFGYGVTLLDLVTGKRAIDFSRLEEEDDVLLLDHVKKLEREKRLEAIVDRNLSNNYNNQEVEMMIQVALLCTQPSPEERPTMSKVVRMLEGEGLAERWEEWQHVEVMRQQEYERIQSKFDWGEDSIYNQDAIELSGGR